MVAFVQSGSNSADGESTSLAVTLTGVAAGNLIVCWSKFEGADTTDTMSDGTSSLAQGAKINHANGDLRGRFFYLVAANSGTRTYTLSLAGARPYKRLHVWEFSSSGTLSLDVQNTGSGAAGTASSGTVTTTGSDAVALGGYGEYTAAVPSNPQINGVAAGGSIINVPTNTYTASWYRLLSATFANGAATINANTGGDWVCNIIVLKTSGGGGGAFPWARRDRSLIL